MAEGDIVLITFPFTDLSGSKLRPAVILAETREDVTVTFITSQLKWQEPNDIHLSPSAENGLKSTSLVRTSKIATLDKALVRGKMGTLSETELKELNDKLLQSKPPSNPYAHS